MIKRLPSPRYSQNDPRWANDKMGETYFTLGQYGCLVTITAAGLTILGHKITPKEFNNYATDKGGYLLREEDGVKYPNMFWKFPDIITKNQIIHAEYQTFTGTGWEELADSILDNGRPVWAEVRYKLNQHWVLILGRVNQNKYWILDPIDGKINTMDYDRVYRITSYKHL